MCFTFRTVLIGQPNTTEKAESHQFANSETRRKSFCHSVAAQPDFYQGKGLLNIGSSLQFSELSTHWNRSQHFNFPCSLTNMTRQKPVQVHNEKVKRRTWLHFYAEVPGSRTTRSWAWQTFASPRPTSPSRRCWFLPVLEKIKRNPFDEDWLKLDEQHIFIQLGFPLLIFLKSSCL